MARDAATNPAWIQVYGGQIFWPLDPQPGDIRIETIAHALSLQCRFCGQIREFYSVASHSIHVSHLCRPEDALWGLLHDASEAYLSDVVRPIKKLPEFAEYRKAEARLMHAVCERFSLPYVEPESIKYADAVALATEVRDLLEPSAVAWTEILPVPDSIRLVSIPPSMAEQAFLRRFKELTA